MATAADSQILDFIKQMTWVVDPSGTQRSVQKFVGDEEYDPERHVAILFEKRQGEPFASCSFVKILASGHAYDDEESAAIAPDQGTRASIVERIPFSEIAAEIKALETAANLSHGFDMPPDDLISGDRIGPLYAEQVYYMYEFASQLQAMRNFQQAPAPEPDGTAARLN